jgi:hypothetical protein
MLIGMTLGLTMAPGRSRAQSPTPPPQAGADVTPTAEVPAEDPWGWLRLPTITMPKINMPKMPADPCAPVKTSARKVSDGAKKAWEGTKEIFTLGGGKVEQPTARVASAGESPSMWQRMFGGAKKPPQPQGPRTVADWMAQPRVE